MSDLTIRWIGQSGYLLSDGNTVICIDPYLSNAVDRVAGRGRMVEAPITPQALRCDAVICSHDHLDHVDIDAIPQMNKAKMRFFAPTHAKKTLLSCGVTDYLPFDEGTEYQIGDFKITAVFAHHSVPAVGILMEHNGLKMYFSGDTEYHEGLLRLSEKSVDVMFICINGKLGNMNVSDAVKLTKILSPRIGIPTHYGMFESNTEDPEKYTSRLPNALALEYDKIYDVEDLFNV